MTIKYITVAPGAIYITKRYNIFRRLWAKITRKELPYNEFTLFLESGEMIADETWPKDMGILIEPKKQYSKKEMTILRGGLNRDADDYEGIIIEENMSTIELFKTLNSIRPDTFADDEANLAALLDNKYYKSTVLSEVNNWNEHIF